jgi:branched-subunit amino acid aminotransferase/4-amino-4-deoxychorismate lyase
MSGLISVNGKITIPEIAAVSALDRGFLFGDNIFEVFVCFEDQVLDMNAHLSRLRASAEALRMSIPWSDSELEFELKALSEQVTEPKKYLRLVVTRGEGLGLRIPANAKPNRIIYCFPATIERPEVYQEGLALKRSLKVGGERGAAAKTGNYLSSILAMEKAESEGFNDILWSNSEGEITEASTANIFFMSRDGDNIEFVTPAAHSGILLGITRSTMIGLIKRAGIPVKEEIIFADEIPRFDEAFLCSTVRGLVPVNRIDRHKMHTARTGAVFRHIERLFLTWVETQLGFRPDWRTGLLVTRT